jgi:hypothetical protein
LMKLWWPDSKLLRHKPQRLCEVMPAKWWPLSLLQIYGQGRVRCSEQNFVYF